jgi:hypothetical protein
LISLTKVEKQNGATKMAANAMRDAAITKEGASRWAKRISSDAADTARIPIKRTSKGEVDFREVSIKGISSVILPFFVYFL